MSDKNPNPTLYICEECQGNCELYDDGECEGAGFYEWPKGDITCPCCGDLVAEEPTMGDKNPKREQETFDYFDAVDRRLSALADWCNEEPGGEGVALCIEGLREELAQMEADQQSRAEVVPDE